MTKAEALIQIGQYCPFAKYPILDTDAQETLASKARNVTGSTVPADGSSVYASDGSVAGAIAAGWRMKAGLAAADFDFKGGDQEFKRSQIVKQCNDMAKSWDAVSAGGAGAMLLGPLTKPDTSMLR